MKICAVILNHNLPADTNSVVADLKKQTVRPEIIVVDNGSTDDSVYKIRTTHPDVKIIDRPINDGVAGGYNAGIREALKNTPDFIAVLNNDLEIPQKDCLEKLVATNAGIAGPLIYFSKGFEYHEKQKNSGKVVWFGGGKIDWANMYHSHAHVDEVDTGQFTKTTPTDFITGAFMLFRREVLEKVGLFSEKYALYLEDAELCERAKRTGYNLLFVPSARAYHKVSQTVGNKIGGRMNDYYITRNRLAFGLTYASLRTKFALLREAVKILLSGREEQKRGIKDFFVGRFGFV